METCYHLSSVNPLALHSWGACLGEPPASVEGHGERVNSRAVWLDVPPVPMSRGAGSQERNSYLVDPASSHMLVSKIKPCMSKYKLLIL